MSNLIRRLFLFVVVGFAVIVVVNRGFVIRQRTAIWSLPLSPSRLVYLVGGLIVVCFLIIFPFLYLRFARLIVIRTVINTAWSYLANQLLPTFLDQLSATLRSSKQTFQEASISLREFWQSRLAEYSRPVRRAFKLMMRRVPYLTEIEQALSEVDLEQYESQVALRADLGERAHKVLHKPQGGGIGVRLFIINLFCLLVVWGVLVIVG